jgi:hypothetical protein
VGRNLLSLPLGSEAFFQYDHSFVQRDFLVFNAVGQVLDH